MKHLLPDAPARSTFLTAVCLSGLLLCGFSCVARAEPALPPAGPRIVLLSTREPAYAVRTLVERFDERLVPLWMRALKRGDEQLLRQVAEACITAKRLGFPGMDDDVARNLQEAFQGTAHPLARRSLAAALVDFGFRPAADDLWNACTEGDFQLALIVEPALAEWGHSAAIARSLERLNEPFTTVPLMRLSVQVARIADVSQAREPLLRIVNDRTERADLRLAAAEALGGIFSEGLTETARQLTGRDRTDDPLASLLAVRVLAEHTGDPAVEILETLAADPIGAVQAAALDRLHHIDPELAARFALSPGSGFSVLHPDANVRRALIRATSAIQRGPAIPVLSRFLDDPHPDNRTRAADALFSLWQLGPAEKSSVERHVLAALDHNSWRVLERAAILAAGLDLEPAAEKLIGLLRHKRGEVGVAAAFALKQLAVADTLPAVLDQLERNIAEHLAPAEAELVAEQTKHLSEQLGVMRYRPADGPLRQFIPKPRVTPPPPPAVTVDPRCRQAAIWALGKLHEGHADEQLVRQLSTRLSDVDGEIPEAEEVRESSAYALGWMGSESALPALRRFASRDAIKRDASTASAWALEQIAGEQIPLPGPHQVWNGHDWFLHPTELPK